MKFDVSAFSFLTEQEFSPGYGNVSQGDLQAQMMSAMALGLDPAELPEIAVIELFDTLIEKLKPSVTGTYDENHVLTVKADANGMIEQVYGPAIFKKDGEIVVKVGANLFPLTIKGTEASVGELLGDVEVLERDGRNEDGAEEKYLAVSWDVYFPAPLDETVEIPFVLDGENKTNKAKFKQALKQGDITPYLREAGTGGNWVSMNDLEIGEYEMTALVANDPHPEYGVSWTMTLAGVGDVRSKGKQFHSKLAIRAPKLMALLKAGQPVTLLVSSKKELSQGIQVNADFFIRPPKADRLVKAAKPVADLKPAQEAPMLTLEATATDIPWDA
jgi:hypothetical protein